MSKTDLAGRAAWFHEPHRTPAIVKRASEDPEAWFAYADWHKAADNPAAATSEQCRDAITQRLARR